MAHTDEEIAIQKWESALVQYHRLSPQPSPGFPQVSLTSSILIHYGLSSSLYHFWYSHLQLYKSSENQVVGIFI